MLYRVTQGNHKSLPGNLLIGQFRLRYRELVVRQNWPQRYCNGREFDAFDTPAATYLVYCDASFRVSGTVRLSPTSSPYMIEEVFSFLADGPLPHSNRIYEASRFCVDHTLAPLERSLIAQALVSGMLDFARDMRCEAFIGIMHPLIWKSVFDRRGWHSTPLGSLHKLSNGQAVQARRLEVQ